MALDISVRNTLDQNAQYSYTSVNTVIGAGTVGLKNINSFSVNDAVQIGKSGDELSEIGLIASLSGTAAVLAGTLKYAHPSDTPVYKIYFDKVIFKRSTAGTAGTATAMSSGTVAITPDGEYTVFSDATGAASYAYKTSFYNSVTAVESADSDWITSSGYPMYSLADIRERTKKKLFDNGVQLKDDSVIDDWTNEWLEEMNNAAIQVDESFSLGSTSVAFGTAGLGTITADDFKEIKRIWVTYDGVTSMKTAKMDISGYWPNDTFTTSHPYYYNYGDNVVGIKPAESGGTASIVYYKLPTRLVNDTDTLPVSMRGYSSSFVSHNVGEYYYLDNQSDRGDRFNGRAMQSKLEFINQITPRGKDGIVTINYDMPVNEGEYDFFI